MANQGGGSSVWLWVGLGCGGLLLVTVCLGGAGAFFFYRTAADSQVAATSFREAAQAEAQAAEAQAEAQRQAAIAQQQAAQQGGPMVPGVAPSDRTPRMITAMVTSVSGTAGVAPGNVCSFAVEYHDQPQRPGGYWCRANVMCGLTLVYGGGQTGYFPCTMTDSPRGVYGQDGDTTATDRDGSFQIDTRTGQISIRDDASGHLGAFSVDATINGVR